MTPAEAAIKNAPLRDAINVIVAAIDQKAARDSDAAALVGSALESVIGKRIEDFEQLEEKSREFFRQAGIVVRDKYRRAQTLFGFMRSTIGHLKKFATAPVEELAKIAVFLTALIDPHEAASLKLRYIQYC